MTRRPLTLLFLVLPFLLPALSAQVDRCGTMANLAAMLQDDPKIADSMAEIEAHTQRSLGSGGGGLDVVRVIPVVVHIVWNTAADNLSDAQIQSQIQVLNEDFRRTNPDAGQTRAAFVGVAADSEFQFCLASRDPSGNPTSGITRTQTASTSFSSGNNNVKFNSSGGHDAWPAASYLNIWVCDISGGVIGYAQFPGGSASTDGVVCDYLYFGSGGSASFPYDLGRTATHEIGHWLNLRHTWGDSSTCGVDDLVADTPDSSAATFGCPYPSTLTQCSSSVQYENYMDYTDDACMNMFSLGQKSRMQALFNVGGARYSLLSSLGCAPSTPQYQVNQTHSGLDIDGVQGTSGTPAVVTRCDGEGGNIHLLSAASNIGLAHDVAISVFPLQAASSGGVTLPDGQIISLRLDLGLFFLSTGTGTPALPPWPGNQTLPYSTYGPGTVSFQKIQFTPSVASGYALSQGAQLDVVAGGGSFPAGPTADDSSVTVSLGGSTCIPGITFFGTLRTSFFVSSNGRVSFVTADSDYSPTLAESLSDGPFVGFWTDLNPTTSPGSSIAISSPGAGLIRVAYSGLRYYGTTVANTFAIEFDTGSNTVTLDNLLSINANTAASGAGTRQFLGISKGNTGAVDPGVTTFTPGGSGTPANPNAMIYQFYNNTGGGLVPALASTALNRIVFTPSGAGYSWAGS